MDANNNTTHPQQTMAEPKRAMPQEGSQQQQQRIVSPPNTSAMSLSRQVTSSPMPTTSEASSAPQPAAMPHYPAQQGTQYQQHCSPLTQEGPSTARGQPYYPPPPSYQQRRMQEQSPHGQQHPLPPPSYRETRQMMMPPGQFIFQAGPPSSQHTNSQRHRAPPPHPRNAAHDVPPPTYASNGGYDHGPPPHYRQQHPPAYRYPPAPTRSMGTATIMQPQQPQTASRRPRSQSIAVNFAMTPKTPAPSSHSLNSNETATAMDYNSAVPQSATKMAPSAPPVQVTPSTALKKNIVSRGSSPTQQAVHTPAPTYKRARGYSISANAYTEQMKNNENQDFKAATALTSSVSPCAATPTTSTNALTASPTDPLFQTESLEKGNGCLENRESDKLGAVEAIFAAAEVIAKRIPSPPTPASNEVQPRFVAAIVHHGSASDVDASFAPTASTAPKSIATTKKVSTTRKAVTTTPKPKRPIKKRKVEKSPKKASPRKRARKSKSNSSSNGSGGKSMTSEQQTLTPEQDRQQSNRALFLSQAIEAEPSLHRALLLHMALERETPRKPGGGAPDHRSTSSSAKSSSSPLAASSEVSIGKRRGNQYVQGIRAPESCSKIIADGFFWKDVPELESILQQHMEEYYEMSENRPQSKKQQQFNNRLVNIIHRSALQYGYTFDPLSFNGSGASASAASGGKQLANAPKLPTKANKVAAEGPDTADNFNYKKLRDRIRCYYKTHVQNSKKRLNTLLKNPTRPKNREVLIRIVEEIRDRDAGRGSGRKLSPGGKAALRRLEAREESVYHTGSYPSENMGVLAAYEASVAQQPGGESYPGMASSLPDSLRDTPEAGEMQLPEGNEQYLSTAIQEQWYVPSSPRRVSLDASRYHRSGEAPPVFASPCKPEHAAMLLSIR